MSLYDEITKCLICRLYIEVKQKWLLLLKNVSVITVVDVHVTRNGLSVCPELVQDLRLGLTSAAFRGCRFGRKATGRPTINLRQPLAIL